jgi:ABC-type glycerol-3-phosphate transport system substrate-binding protein
MKILKVAGACFLIISFFSTLAFAEEKITLNFMARWQGEHKRADLVREVVREFEFLHPEIKVNMKFFEELGLKGENEVGEYTAKMIQDGKTDWDIVLFNTGQYFRVGESLNDPEWVKKYLVDFSDFPWFKETQKEVIFSDPNYKKESGDIFVGPYIEGFYCMIWYNKAVADKIGLKIKDYGMTDRDLIGYVKAVYEYNQKHATSIGAFYEAKDWRSIEYLFQNLFKSEVGDLNALNDEEFTPIKQRALLKTLQFFEELAACKPLIDSFDENIWYATRGMVLDDTALFFVNGSWMYSHWMNIDERKTMKMFPAELPVFRSVNFCMGSYTPQFAVMKNSPHKQAAIEFLKFWSRPEVAEKWVLYTKCPTGIKGHFATSDSANDQFERFQAVMNEKYRDRFHFKDNEGFILGYKNRLLKSFLNEIMINVLSGKMKADEAYEEIIKKIEK